MNEPPPSCPRCSAPLPPGALVCPACGQLVYVDRLNALAAQAVALEAHDPHSAANVWRQTLPLLPEHSQQYASVRNRIGALASGFAIPPMPGAPPPPPQYAARAPRNDSLGRALLWTFGSMIVSIVIYSMNFGLPFATGFVLLILIHELGHVVANMYYGIKASPPIFVPYLGAVINLRQSPPNAKVEAIVGIGGPVFGAAASLACAAFVYKFPEHHYAPLMLELSFFGCFMNLFNLLPVPPLDGGRVTAAVSPWIWMLGVAGMIGLAIMDYRSGHPSYILILLAFYAFPRIWRTLTTGERNAPYYQIGWRASAAIGAAYLLLLLVLIGGLVWGHSQGVQTPF